MGPTRRRPATAARPGDALAVTTVAWVRVGIAVGAAASGSIPAHLSDKHRALFLLLGLVWVPWSVAVLFASERTSAHLALRGGPIGDLLALFATQTLAPQAGEAVLSGYVVVIAFAAYTEGRTFAGVLAGAAISLSILARAVTAADVRLDPGVVAVFAVAAVAIVFLLDRTSALQARATARAARLQSASEAVLARIADGVVVTDARGTILSCNPAFERIIGQASSSVAGRACDDVLGLHVDERRLDCAGGCALLVGASEAEAALGHEVWRADDRRRRPLLANATAVTDEDGLVVEVVHSVRDITRLKQSEEAKTLFLATASHELKTPLTVIRGFVETMLDTDMDPGSRRIALQAVQRRSVELADIVDRLLLSSRIEAGRVELTLTDVPVREVLEDRVLTLASATGRVVDVDIAPEVDLVHGDVSAIATVVEHLIDNAVKYSPDGGQIALTATVTDERVVIEVSDEGIGMDAEQTARCFDKFWQAESTDVRRFGGTGIGLYIVRSLVEAMGGRITATSTPDIGTTFEVVLLPADADRATDEQVPGVGETTMIREFMRQIGVPQREG